MLEFVQGDIFEFPVDIRVNTVNCVGVMGAGVALAFKQRYPAMFRDYQDDCKNGQVKPGKVNVWKSLSGDWVINFPTKRDWREPSRYEDIDAGLDDLRRYLDSVGPVTVALPALGCGNGGLDWNRVSGMIRGKLEGVNAHVFVFEPDASRRAGKNSAFATDDERNGSRKLGYELLEQERAPGLKAPGPVYFLGQESVLLRKWIALLPSRGPGEREVLALRSIATEIATSATDVSVALVYGTKFSEEIAQIFVEQRVQTVVLVPFGVLTRKALAKNVSFSADGILTIASAAPASAKWSRPLFAQAMDMLRLNSAAVLVSDPEPNWLTNKGLDRWGHIPISYVRYETTSDSTRHALAHVNAKPVTRRGDTGAPNIENLLGPFRHDWPSSPDTASLTMNRSAHKATRAEPKSDGENLSQQESEVITFNLDEYPNEERRALFEALVKMELREFAVRLPNASDRRQLKEWGFRRNED